MATVKVMTLQAHTAFGKSYDIGDTYDAPADLVDSLVVQGKAAPADPKAAAKASAKPAKTAKKARKATAKSSSKAKK